MSSWNHSWVPRKYSMNTRHEYILALQFPINSLSRHISYLKRAAWMEVKLCSVSQVPLWMRFYILITKKHFISSLKRENLHQLLNSSHHGLKCSKSTNKQSPNRKMAKFFKWVLWIELFKARLHIQIWVMHFDKTLLTFLFTVNKY